MPFVHQAGGLGREEVASMIERATSNFLKTMKGRYTTLLLPFWYKVAVIVKERLNDRGVGGYFPFISLIICYACPFAKRIKSVLLCSAGLKCPVIKVKNVKDELWKLATRFTLKENVFTFCLQLCTPEFTASWKQSFFLQTASLPWPTSRTTWYIWAVVQPWVSVALDTLQFNSNTQYCAICTLYIMLSAEKQKQHCYKLCYSRVEWAFLPCTSPSLTICSLK